MSEWSLTAFWVLRATESCPWCCSGPASPCPFCSCAVTSACLVTLSSSGPCPRITPQLLIQPLRGQIRKLQDLKWGVWGPMNSILKGPQEQITRLLLPSSADPCTTSFCSLYSRSLSVPSTMFLQGASVLFLDHLWLQIPCCPLMTSCLANS